jgi:hypothetical protein
MSDPVPAVQTLLDRAEFTETIEATPASPCAVATHGLSNVFRAHDLGPRPERWVSGPVGSAGATR